VTNIKMADEEQKAVMKQRNWADEDGESGDDDDVEIGGTTVAQVGQVKAAAASGGDKGTYEATVHHERHAPRNIVPPKPRTKREKNIYGDFVVTKINIKERVIVVPENEGSDEEEEESEEESEEEVSAQTEPVEEVKKEPVKILSKKQ